MATPLADSVMGALADALQEQDNKPVPTAFIMVASILLDDGSQSLCVLAPEGQGTHASLGLVTYADEWFRDDVRYQIAQLTEDGAE